MASPITFVLSVFISVQSRDPIWARVSGALLAASMGGVVAAPAIGLVLALVGRRWRARRRFAAMAAVSAAVIILLLLLWELIRECPDGYHC
ncbi:hypothetical protein B1C81_39335 [Streptomyces sp. HG99]|nr:hypothetical protein B1C81_39335 [Streptomyces sp. HG99]